MSPPWPQRWGHQSPLWSLTTNTGWLLLIHRKYWHGFHSPVEEHIILMVFLSMWEILSPEIWKNTWSSFAYFTGTYFCFLWNNCNHKTLLDEGDFINVPCLPFQHHLHFHDFGMRGICRTIPGTFEIPFSVNVKQSRDTELWQFLSLLL